MTTQTSPIITLALVGPNSNATGHATLASAAQAAPPIAGRSDGGAGTVQQEGQPLGAPGQQQAAQPQGMGGMGMFLPLILMMFVFMIVMQIFAGRKEKKRRAEMLGGLTRHDRVQTIGGVIGTVAEIRDDEIVLKVDEATNTKLRIARSAVQSVLKKSSSSASTSDTLAPAETVNS
ncbi:MAG: preprotein translocase subunit YajC [Phycisphaerales bacterium]|nr:MAG: preprotein translocase subunit YajC [Phycisphaerales bacterium]